MPELLLELRSGEIPAPMQAQAREHLLSFATNWLQEQQVPFTSLEAFISPTRFVLVIHDVLPVQPDQLIERKGPRIDAAPPAIEGFLRSTKATLPDLEKRETPKGIFYFYQETVPGKKIGDLVPLFVSDIIDRFPWPKRMFWGASTRSWIRPLYGGCAVFDGSPLVFDVPLTAQEAESPLVLQFDGTTLGHRFMEAAPFAVTGFEDYQQKLRQHFVIIDPDERKSKILDQLQTLCEPLGLKAHYEPDLLDEIVGLTEWPICQIGTFPPVYLDLPAELLKMVMRVHQRYFALQTPAGQLSAQFIYTSNLPKQSIPPVVTQGNERVLCARFEDARFYFELDSKQPMDHYREALRNRLFFEGLGSLYEKTERLRTMAASLEATMFPHNDWTHELLDQVCAYARADLSTALVAEFPELQGIIGAYYARRQLFSEDVAQAFYDQYRPSGPEDDLPKTFLGCLYVLLDRTDTLVGFFSIDQRPTGSKDPFALRRAALALVRILETLEGSLTVQDFIALAISSYEKASGARLRLNIAELEEFIYERLRIFWRDQLGYRADLIQAVLQSRLQTPLFHLKARLEQLTQFVENAEPQEVLGLVQLHKRVANILKQAGGPQQSLKPEMLAELAEKSLFEAMTQLEPQLKMHLHQHSYEKAFHLLLTLKPALEDFFLKITVMTDDTALRSNRLALLSLLNETFERIADFSSIELLAARH